jgi:hypothetical protein
MVFLAGYLAVATIGYGLRDPVRASTNEFLNLPARWDAGWYLGIASGGYRWNPEHPPYERLKFFPAYPILLRAVALPVDSARHEVVWLWIGVILSTLLFWLALMYVFRLGAELRDEETGRRAVWITATYPFAIFFGLPYSESLFLASTCGALYSYRRREWAMSAAWGCIAGLTRPNGFLVSAGLILLQPSAAPKLAERRFWRGVAALAPAFGTALFSLYLYVTTGDALAWTIGQPGARTSLNPLAFVRDLSDTCWRLGPSGCMVNRGYDILNVGAALIPIALVVPVLRQFGAAFASIVALNTAMPLFGIGFNCMGRYTSVMFPMFLWWAGRLGDRQVRWWIAVSVLCQCLMAAAFFTWRPVY